MYETIIPFKAKLFFRLSKTAIKLSDNCLKIVPEMMLTKSDIIWFDGETYNIEKIIYFLDKNSNQVDICLPGMVYKMNVNGKIPNSDFIVYLIKEY